MEQFDDIVKEFLVESYENLDQLDRDLIALESSPSDRDRLSSVFRTIHTLKGTSGFLAFPKLEHVAHIGENLLVPLRDGELRLNADIASGLLSMVDAIRNILGQIESTGEEGADSYETLVDLLGGLNSNSSVPCSSPAAASTPVASSLEPQQPSQTPDSTSIDSTAVESTKTDSAPLNSVPLATGRPKAAGHVQPAISRGPATSAAVPTTDPALEPEAESGERSPSISDSTVRIDVHLLDRLMNLVGELVLARNQILQFSRSTEDSEILTASQRLNHITTELQAGVMKTRMQPISNAWNKLPRIVRDVSAACGKRVQIKLEGADTELDKTILEAIRDPLTHIVRNSVDHGIEVPAIRQSRGKPAEGTLCLRAFHEGGQVNIEICDDGGGIDVERVRNKAIQQQLITTEQAAGLSERELIQLILQPGFSTAEKVTNVSGRGVGMDVVKTNIERIGGTLDIQSILHQGTTLRIRIPLTLAIVPALIVACQAQRFAIPQVSLLELVRLEGERARREIELIHSSPVLRLRGKLLPIVYLDEQLGLRPARKAGEHHSGEAMHVIVLQAEDRQFGLIVDRICDTQEIVVKPLGPYLKSLTAYAGATMMGDGTIALILDVSGVAQQAGILVAHRDPGLSDLSQSAGDQPAEKHSWLLVDPGDNTRAAMPLASVSRLEEVDPTAIEFDGAQEVVQYRGQIMPLVRLCQPPSHFRQPESNGKLPVVVFTHGQTSTGVVVGRIVDIVESPRVTDSPSSQVMCGRVTRVIDPASLALAAGHLSEASGMMFGGPAL